MILRLFLRLTVALSPCFLLGQSISPDSLPATTRTAVYPNTQFTVSSDVAGTWSISAGALPAGLSLTTGGLLSGTISPSASLGANSFTVRFLVTSFTFVPTPVLANYTITVNAIPAFSAITLPAGTVGSAYSTTNIATARTGGTAPLSFTLASGVLPPGLSLNTSGAISGTPTGSGSFSFAVRVTDAAGVSATTPSLSLVVNPAPTGGPLALISNNLPIGIVGLPYPPTQFGATGGSGTGYTFSSDTLPFNLTISPSGLLSGVPSAPYGPEISITLTDSASNSISASLLLTIVDFACPDAIAIIGSTYSSSASLSFFSPISFSSSGTLPPGLAFSNSGSLNGTPTSAGSFTFNITAVDSFSRSVTRACTIHSQSAIQSTWPRTIARVGVTYNSHVSATGGNTAYTHSITAGSLPPGLTLNPATGQITGMPSSSGSFAYRVLSTSSTLSTERDFFVNVLARDTTPTLRCPLPGAASGAFYSSSASLNASGNITYTLLGSSIPGLTFNSATGRLSGTPVSPGFYTFTINASGATAGPVSASCSLSINESTPAPLNLACPDQTDLVVGEPYLSTAVASGGLRPYTYSTYMSSLPAGLSLDPATGIISGTLAGLPPGGTFTYGLRVTDGQGNSNTSNLCTNSVETAPPLSILTTSLPPGVVGFPYNVTLSTSGGIPPLTSQISSGSLPPGLQLITNSAGTRITGTPLAPGSTNFRVLFFDNASQSASRDYALTITQSDPLRLLTSVLNGATVGISFAQTLEATGGTPPYRFSNTGGNPAPGISFSSGGTLSGTPTTAGNFRYEVELSDAAGGRVFAAYNLAVFQGNFRLACPNPQAELGTPYNASANVLGGSLPYLFSIASGALPPGLNLDSANGVITGRPTATGLFPFTFSVSDARQNRTQTQCSIGVLAGSLRILTEGPINARAGENFSAQLESAGGSAPFSWSLLGAAPEAGLSLAPSGALSGRPTRRGSFAFTVQVRDAGGATAVRTLALNVGDSTLSLACPTEARFQLGVSASGRFVLSGGLPPYVLNLASGALPQGFTLNPDGSFTVRALQAGVFPVTLQASDSSTTSVTTRCSLEITGQPFTITNSNLPDARAGAPYSTSLSTSGGVGNVRFSLTSGALPSGLDLDPNSGAISGTPEPDGNYSVGITATDSLSRRTSRSLPLVVSPANLPFRITTASPLSDGLLGSPYSASFSTSGGRAPITFSITGLPSGLTASGDTFSGSPNVAGNSTISVTARDAAGATTSKPFLLRILADGLFITTPWLPDGVTGEAYSAAFEAQGGRPPFTWAILSGAIPPGLSFDSSTGAFSGTLTGAGPFFVSVEVSDSSGATSRRSYTLDVLPPATPRLSITTATLPPASAGLPYSTSLGATGGLEPYTWSLNGTLPAGLSFSPEGFLSGTPTATGTFLFSVSVRDSLGFTVSRTLPLEVRADVLPSLSLDGLPDTASSNQNLPFTLRIATPFPLALSGRLSLSLAPDSIHNADDPNIRFGNNTRIIDFTIPAGATSITIPATSMTIATGTLAGTIRVASTLNIAGANVAGPIRTVLIRRAAPTITNIRLTRTAGGLEIRAEGFTNTRQLSEARLSFTAGSNVDLTTSTTTVNVAAAISAWFASAASNPFGGQFALTLPFTVSGDPANITGVSLILVNGEGPSTASNSN
jgi:hypothetical protein